MATFQEQLQKVSAFLSPGNLAQQMIGYDGIALLVIDVQTEFCDPQRGPRGNFETAMIARRIQSLMPEFRKAGIPVYAVYFGMEDKRAQDVDFYQFTPEEGDTVVRKSTNSAFKHSDLKPSLERDGRKLLLTCGFNLNACVYKTAIDARDRGYDICLLRDLTGNDNNHADENPEEFLAIMRRHGVAIERSADVLAQLRKTGSTP